MPTVPSRRRELDAMSYTSHTSHPFSCSSHLAPVRLRFTPRTRSVAVPSCPARLQVIRFPLLRHPIPNELCHSGIVLLPEPEQRPRSHPLVAVAPRDLHQLVQRV